VRESPLATPEHRPSLETEFYWQGVEVGELRVQRCTGCGKLRHYPRPVCDQCFCLDWDWVVATGRGRLHSWTVAHHPFHPGFADKLPYILAIVDLEEGVRALGRMDHLHSGLLRIDLPLKARFLQEGPGPRKLFFDPIDSTG
jgi:uncharacterized OB-fold protein